MIESFSELVYYVIEDKFYIQTGNSKRIYKTFKWFIRTNFIDQLQVLDNFVNKSLILNDFLSNLFDVLWTLSKLDENNLDHLINFEILIRKRSKLDFDKIKKKVL